MVLVQCHREAVDREAADLQLHRLVDPEFAHVRHRAFHEKRRAARHALQPSNEILAVGISTRKDSRAQVVQVPHGRALLLPRLLRRRLAGRLNQWLLGDRLFALVGGRYQFGMGGAHRCCVRCRLAASLPPLLPLAAAALRPQSSSCLLGVCFGCQHAHPRRVARPYDIGRRPPKAYNRCSDSAHPFVALHIGMSKERKLVLAADNVEAEAAFGVFTRATNHGRRREELEVAFGRTLSAIRCVEPRESAGGKDEIPQPRRAKPTVQRPLEQGALLERRLDGSSPSSASSRNTDKPSTSTVSIFLILNPR